MAFSSTVESTVMAWKASTDAHCIRTATATVALSQYSPPLLADGPAEAADLADITRCGVRSTRHHRR